MSIGSSDSTSETEVSVRHVRDSRRNDDEGPPAKIRRVSNEDEGDGETCPICLESCGTSRDHQLVSLKCGHLFGSRCVERWLRACFSMERSCPTCKTKASISDLRRIYGKRLRAVNSAEITAMQEQVKQLQAKNERVEMELQRLKTVHRACIQQIWHTCSIS